jgi:hypothetical protein
MEFVDTWQTRDVPSLGIEAAKKIDDDLQGTHFIRKNYLKRYGVCYEDSRTE